MTDAALKKLLKKPSELAKLCRANNISTDTCKTVSDGVSNAKKSESKAMLDSLCTSGNKSLQEDKVQNDTEPVDTPECGTGSSAESSAEADIASTTQLRFPSEPTAMLIFGPPKRGKSYLLKQMFMNPPIDPETGKSAIQIMVIFTPTFKDWADVPNAKKCVRSWSRNNIKAIMKHQMETSGKYHAAIIIDDLLAVISYDDEIMVELFTRHRHYNMTIVISAQNITKTIHPIIRNMISIFVTFDLPSLESSKIIYDAFGADCWPSVTEMFKQIKKLNLRPTHSYVIINVGDSKFTVGREC